MPSANEFSLAANAAMLCRAASIALQTKDQDALSVLDGLVPVLQKARDEILEARVSAAFHSAVLPAKPEIAVAPEPPQDAPKPARPARKAGKGSGGRPRSPDLKPRARKPTPQERAGAAAFVAHQTAMAEVTAAPQPIGETRPRSRGDIAPINGNRIQASALPFSEHAVSVLDDPPRARAKACKPSTIDDGHGTSDSAWEMAKSGPKTAPMTRIAR